ncbi:MAG: CoA-transferase subunit beta [Vulcanimicrobiaceae bacterium]
MSEGWTPAEYIVVNLARAIRPGEITASGVNSVLPMVACVLAKRAYDFEFTYISVAGGVDVAPRKLPRSSIDPVLLGGSASIFANEDLYDLAARGRIGLMYLGAAQIDALGRTNVSAIGSWHAPKVRLPGGGGAAVLMQTVKRIAAWRTEHSPRSFVDKLDFVTAAGNLAVLVTPFAVFEREPGATDRFHLASHRGDTTPAQIAERTGFAFDAARAVPTPPMTPRERAALDALAATSLIESELPKPRVAGSG